MKPIALVLAAALAGCATIDAAGPVEGRWGGQHVGLDLGPASGRLDYDCAEGTIDGPLVSDRSGHFYGRGSHIPGTGGPVRAGVIPQAHPAHYSGSVTGDTMTLVVEVPAIGARIGPYTLRRNAPPILMRCL